MKKLYIGLIILGILCAAVIIYISAVSEVIDENVKSIGFVVIGYLGVISFTIGWVKVSNLKKEEIEYKV